MPPPALSRLVPELYHVSVDYFVARPGLVLLPVLPVAFSGHFCWSVAKKVDQLRALGGVVCAHRIREVYEEFATRLELDAFVRPVHRCAGLA